MPKHVAYRGTAALALWLCVALPALAQDTTDSIQTLIDAEPVGGSVTVEGARTPGGFIDPNTKRTYTGDGLTITKDLTLSGDEAWRTDYIIISASGFPALNIDNGATVTIENLTFTSDSDQGIRVLEGGTIKINRCYLIDNAAEGITLKKTDLAVISNCSIVNNSSEGILVNSDVLKTFVGQSTFLDNGGDAMRVEGGTADIFASLIDRNTGPLTETGGTFKAHGCLVLPSGSMGPEVEEVSPVTGVTPSYSTDPQQWTGKLAAGITSTLQPSDLPTELKEFDATDFEGQSRVGDLEVGADEVDLGADLAWLDCLIVPDPVGKDQTVAIALRLGSLSFDGAANNIEVYIEPQFDGDITNPAKRLLIPVGQLEIISTKRAVARQTFTGPYFSNSFATNLLMDGRAHVYLRDVPNDKYYGLGLNEADVHPDAIDGSDFLIDTTPPRVGLLGTNTADGRAHDFIIAVVDGTFDGDPDGSLFPAGWEPAAPANPQGLAPANGARMFMVNDPGVDRRNPRIFFNLGVPTGLAFNVQGLFVDVGPLDALGAPYNVETAGFPALTDLIDPGDSVPSLINQANQALFPAEAFEPEWTTNIPTNSPLAGPAAMVTVSYAAVTTNAEGFPTSLQVTWSLAGLDYFPFDDGLNLYPNDWNVDIAFRAYDRGGTPSADHSPIEVWWMATAAATLTSNRYNGSPAQDPAFTWDLVRGESPGPSEPCVPLAKFRIYKADNPGDLVNTPWTAISTWSEWSARTAIDRTSVINFSAGTSLGTVIDNPLNQQSYLMIVVAGADESGNVQPTGIGNTITMLQLCTNGIVDPCAAVQPGLCNEVYGTCNRLDFDIWQNEGLQALIQTDVQAHFWNNLVTGATPAELHSVQGNERDYGSSTRVPLTRYEDCDFRLEGALGINTSTPAPGAHWQIYEDGRIVAEGDIFATHVSGVQSYFELVIPTDLLDPPAWVQVDGLENFLNARPAVCGGVVDRLGDDGDGPDTNGANRRRSVNYLVTASGVLQYDGTSESNPVVYDATPAAVRFTVYPDEEEFKTEQPVKSFTRE